MINIPLEIIQEIYKYCNIDTRLIFNSIFGNKFFFQNNISDFLNSEFKSELDGVIFNKISRYNILNELKVYFLRAS